MKKLSNIEAEVKKALLIKKRVSKRWHEAGLILENKGIRTV